MSVARPRSPRSLRHSIVMMLSIGLLLLTGTQYMVIGQYVERQLLDIESADAFNRLEGLHHALDVLQEDLASTTVDWAQWDEAFEFASHRAPQFPANNFDPGSIGRLRLDLVAVTDAHGTPMFAGMLNGDRSAMIEPPADFLQMIDRSGVLANGNTPRAVQTGLISTSAGVFLISSQPILESSGIGAPAGRLIMGRSLVGFVGPALTRTAGEQLQVQNENTHEHLAAYRFRHSDRLMLRDNVLYGVTPLRDLWNHPVAQLQIRMARPTQAMMSDARRYLLGVTLVIGVSFGLAGMAILRRKVVNPLEDIAAAVATIGFGGKTSARVPDATTTSELATLSSSINAMLTQLEQQQKMQSDRDAAIAANRLKSAFLATMSHEIRTPMNGVLGMGELLQLTPLDPRQRHLTDTILRSARALLDILNDILDFSKIESDKLQLESAEFSLIELLRDVAAPFAAAAQAKSLEFSLRIEPDVPALVRGDALRLRQILNNLISNAVKFTECGSLQVMCSAVLRQGDAVEVRFTVTDTGIGIPPAAQLHIFDPFVQAESSTSRRFGGTGLGLAIVRRLVTLMGGRVGVESEVGRGSTFWFTAILPVAAPASLPLPAAANAPRPRFPAGQMPCILLAEDDPLNSEVLTAMLEHMGCRVTLAQNGAEAVAAVAGNKFHMILMDCQMPVMDGQTAAAEVRAMEQAMAQPKTAIVALTANTTAENRQRCLEAGMDSVATKPISQAGLYDIIVKVMQTIKHSQAEDLLPSRLPGIAGG